MSIPALSLGVLFNTDRLPAVEFLDYARRVESAGIDSVWLAELFGREPIAAAGLLLSATSTLQVGTAIANVYARDAVAAAAAATTLSEASDGRFALGLGVSNPGLNGARGHEWTAPGPRLAQYLEQLRSAKLTISSPGYPVWVAAHGPKMLEAAAGAADGVFTYLMNPEHTARTRASLPEGAGLSPMMMCLRCEDPGRARALARRAVGYYLGLDYYHRAWRKLGFEAADFADEGSDRLIDAVVAWGSIEDIKRRIDAHRKAGATQLVMIPLNPAGGTEPDWALLDRVAAA